MPQGATDQGHGLHTTEILKACLGQGQKLEGSEAGKGAAAVKLPSSGKRGTMGRASQGEVSGKG